MAEQGDGARARENALAETLGGLLVLVRALHARGAVDARQRAALKDAVFGCHPALLRGFAAYRAGEPAEALIGAMLRVCDEGIREASQQRAKAADPAEAAPSGRQQQAAGASVHESAAASAAAADGGGSEEDEVDEAELLESNLVRTGCQWRPRASPRAFELTPRRAVHLVDLDSMWGLFDAKAAQAALSREELLRCTRPLIQHHADPTAMKAFLLRLFELLDRSGEGRVSLREILVALALLCRVPLAAKRKFLFRIMDLDADDALATDDVRLLLYSCACAVACILEFGGARRPFTLREVRERAEEAFREAGLTQGRVTLEEFEAWPSNPAQALDELLRHVFFPQLAPEDDEDATLS
jgi:Ca2+-binding EF-hand superfamily protein